MDYVCNQFSNFKNVRFLMLSNIIANCNLANNNSANYNFYNCNTYP